ncbi:MAG: cysteine desulfurase family protein [Candidatus Sumerlaeota bacterium]
MSADRRVYADYNATAPPRPGVIQAMAQAQSLTGNPSAIHREGAAARYAVEKARRAIAKAINAPSPEALIFTSGGSESNNFALKGIIELRLASFVVPHVIVSAADHKAVLDPVRILAARERIKLTILPVDSEGRVRGEQLRAALLPDTHIVSIIFANNEVGSINDIVSLAKITHENSRALLHTDAVQALGRIPIDVQELGVDLMSISAHKLGGPKGIGALYRRFGVELDPLIGGGGQESHLRAGTENVPAIAGFATAVSLAMDELPRELARRVVQRETLWEELRELIPTAVRNSPVTHSLPNTLNVSIPGFDSRRLVALLDERGIACSAGSACTSADPEPSHVLQAMQLPDDVVNSAIRLSFGPETTNGEMASVLQAFQNLS